MAARKTKLTLACVQAEMSNKAAAQPAGITPETLCRWIKRREKAESGLFRQFYQSLQAAQLDFELANFKIIQQSSPATKSSMAILSYTAAIAKSWTQAGKATDDGRRRPAPGVRLTIGGLS